jgi:tetratricopeptide (TPR) repeat protein
LKAVDVRAYDSTVARNAAYGMWHIRQATPRGRRLRSGLISLAPVLVLLLSPLLGQAQEHDHSQSAGSIPAEILERSLPLRTGIGTSHESVTTTSPEAQRYFDQGLSYLHSYVWIEAARSFNQALRLDPSLAMAYLGLSYAYSGLGAGAAAKTALEKAQTGAIHLTELERQRISIRDAQLEAIAKPTDSSLRASYVQAIARALSLFADDVELWLLRGNAEEPSPAGWGQRGTESSLKYYDKALSISPDNFAAHHYLTHSLENIGRIQQALAHGEAYARLAPMVAHAQHMWGHDLRRVGRIDDAIKQFEKAYELEVAYYQSENIPAEDDWHHQHNLDLLSGAYQYVGRMKSAEQMSKESFAFPALQENMALDKRGWPFFLLSRGRDQEALDAGRVLIDERWPSVRAIGHAVASQALMAMNRLAEAASEAKAAIAEAQAEPAAEPYIDPYLALLQGEFFLRTGQQDKGRGILKAVESKVRAEPGPDAWSQALFVLEMIGQLAVGSGDWQLAEYTAGQMNQHDPAYAGSHFLRGLVAEHKGDTPNAISEFKLAQQSWKEADADLPEMARIKSKLAALEGP